MSLASRVVPSLPRIKVPVGIKPQKLKLTGMDTLRGRLEILRQSVCNLFREERAEMKYNRAVECQPYAERLLQMAVRRGASDPYTSEIMDWWLVEGDLHDKIFKILVPRFREMEEPYTAIYRLPKVYVPGRTSKMNQQYHGFSAGVLELRGNPFPSIEPLEERRKKMLEDLVRQGINEKRYR